MVGQETLLVRRQLTGNWAKGQNKRVSGERHLKERVVKPGSLGWEHVPDMFREQPGGSVDGPDALASSIQ